ERHRALVGIEHGEGEGGAAPDRNAVAQRLPLERLDLDDLGARLGHQQRRIGALIDLAKIDHCDSGERQIGLAQWNDPPSRSRAMMWRCTSLGPSPTRRMRISRYQRSS